MLRIPTLLAMAALLSACSPSPRPVPAAEPSATSQEISTGPAPSGPTSISKTEIRKTEDGKRKTGNGKRETAALAASGLYTPADRAAALALLQKHCPELDGIVFDADGDGLVTALEQDGEGRDPLSQILTRESVAAAPEIPWTPDLFPEWLMTAFVQEDAPVGGTVGTLPTRGVLTNITATALSSGIHRESPDGGIVFPPGAQLSFPGTKDAHWFYRWGVLVFRVLSFPNDDSETVLLDVNTGNSPSRSSPRIAYNHRTGRLSVRFVGRGAKGLDIRELSAHCDPGWNVAVFGMRQGNLFLDVNGTDAEYDPRFSSPYAPVQPGRYAVERLNDKDLESRLGDSSPDSVTWTLDALLLGQTEPSEAQVRKLVGWAAHRRGFADRLPKEANYVSHYVPNHPYRDRRPVLDVEDLPHRFRVDDDAWAALLARNADKSFTRSCTGQPREDRTQGYERVFFDDFRAFRIADSRSGAEGPWMAPGYNTAVGGKAPLLAPGRDPDVYPHDDDRGIQTFSLARKGDRWYGSAAYTVNDMGQGYSWAGPKVFRVRCRFPAAPDGATLPKGLFPAFWSYGTEYLYWRTSNRIECDWFELEGANPRWLNGLSTHLHYTHVKNPHVRRADSYPRFKLMGAELKEELVGIPGGIRFWDGAFHTWEFAVGPDLTVISITVPDAGAPGGERWIELCRGQTSPTYLEPLFLLFDYALKTTDGMPADGARCDFDVDWVEVLQRTEDIERLPSAFAERPALRKNATALYCSAHTPGVTDLRYYWFADDGYPVTFGASARLPLDRLPAGTKSVRCMVKAAGALDQPEAWTEPCPLASPDNRLQ